MGRGFKNSENYRKKNITVTCSKRVHEQDLMRLFLENDRVLAVEQEVNSSSPNSNQTFDFPINSSLNSFRLIVP